MVPIVAFQIQQE